MHIYDCYYNPMVLVINGYHVLNKALEQQQWQNHTSQELVLTELEFPSVEHSCNVLKVQSRLKVLGAEHRLGSIINFYILLVECRVRVPWEGGGG